MNSRMIFAYYVNPNDIYNVIYKWHLLNINENIHFFNIIDFYLLIDNIEDYETIEKIKEFILSKLTNLNNEQEINFYIEQNDSFLREGKIYKKYVIDKLSEYNDIIFFGHTKGLVNLEDGKDLNNILWWISTMYALHLNIGYWDAINKLINNNDICAYGAIYNYSESNHGKYKWIFYGGFSMINPIKLTTYLKEINYDYKEFDSIDNYTRVCAEQFLPSVLPTEKISYLSAERFNLKYNCILYDSGDFPYKNIFWVAYNKMTVDTSNAVNTYYNNLLNKLNEK